MSRSRKKVKIRSISNASSEKEDKQAANRKLRRIAKQQISKTGEVQAETKTLSNSWGFSKDGKFYDAEMQAKDLRK